MRVRCTRLWPTSPLLVGLCGWGMLGACSLQMPQEDEVFAGEPGSESGGSGGGGMLSGGTGTGGGVIRGGAGTGGDPVDTGGTGGISADDGLIAHFPFDETSGDVAANLADSTQNGTYVGDCTHPAGRIDYAVSIRNMDGATTSEWIELPEGLLSDLAATTVSLWVRDMSTARAGGRLFHFSRGASEEIYFSPHDINPADSLEGAHLVGTHLGDSFVDLWATSPALTDKDWHHVAVTWSSASIELYVDGTAVGRQEAPGVQPTDLGSTSPNWLGRTLDDAFIALYAEIDDLRVYNRVLTASEIEHLHDMN